MDKEQNYTHLIIGGGLAGMEAAITLKKRGHEVDLYEKDELGGQFVFAPLTPHKKSMGKLVPYFKKELKNMGFDTGHSDTPITPVMVGESSKAKELSNGLYDEGVFALPIVFPMVARDKARIRTMMNAGLTRKDLDFALEKFEKLGKKLDII